MALDQVFVRFQCVHFTAKGEPGYGVNSEAHQVGLQVDVRARARRRLPAGSQALGDAHQRWKIGTYMSRIETRHHHAPLPAPGIPVRAKNTRGQAHFVPDHLQPWRTPKSVWPVPQHPGNRVVLGHHQEAGRPQCDLEHRAKTPCPALNRLVRTLPVKLQQVTDQGPATWTGQF